MVDPISGGEIYSTFHPTNNWHMFERPYELVNVSVLQTVSEEEVFPCIALTKGTNEVKLYLISHEYNFGLWMNGRAVLSDHSERRSRFVFEYIKARQMASLLAVAEEPADYDDYSLGDLRDPVVTSS